MIQRIVDSVITRGNKMMYLVIYLSPGDYHRYHSPAYFIANYRRHIAGYLEPVRPSYLEKHKEVLKNNERVNVLGSWYHGFFAMSFIGALNVGSINLHFDDVLKTNKASPEYPYINDKNYLVLINQMDEQELSGNKMMTVPEYKDPDLKNKSEVISTEEMMAYLKEFDVKDVPSVDGYTYSLQDEQTLVFNLPNKFRSMSE